MSAPLNARAPLPGPFAPRLRFAGYAALFHQLDGGGDRILPGAFRNSLREQGSSLPLFWQHQAGREIGTCDYLTEDARGLRVIGRLFDPASLYAESLRKRHISGLSFGFRARRFRFSGDTRLLSEVDIFEISLVTHPLQPGARVHLISA